MVLMAAEAFCGFRNFYGDRMQVMVDRFNGKLLPIAARNGALACSFLFLCELFVEWKFFAIQYVTQ